MAQASTNGRDGQSDTARLLLAAARERFSVAATDLLLPETSRLTEWQRLTAAALLGRLVRTIEDSLRARLAGTLAGHEELHAALSSASVPIALPLLERAQVLRDADLGTILVRRVEEHRFWKAQADAGADTEALLGELVRNADEAVAAAAMALLIARSRRFDQYQEPIFGQTELPAELQHRLVWMIAAALRQYMVQQHSLPATEADAAIAEAASEVLAGYDEGESMEAAAMRLALALDQTAQLEDVLLLRMLEEGLLPLFVAGMAVRLALDFASSWEVLSDPRGLGPALLLRAALVRRDQAAAILLVLNRRGRLFSGREGDAAADQLELYEATEEAHARGVLRLWQADPGYRAAVARLSTRARSAAGPA